MEPVTPSDQEAIREQVDRIAASPTFRNAERLVRFLRFITVNALDRREDALKESVIGVEVFDRRPSYDPKLEPIVRIQARRLRAKLDAYYQAAGAADTVRIEIPKGGYIPQFIVRPPAPPADAPPRARRTRPRALMLVAAALVIVAVVVVAYNTSRPDAPAPQLLALTSYVGDEFCPAVSPDGRQLAFSWDRDGNADIYVTPVGSSNPVRLTTDPGHDLSPAWSPDGSTIAFYRETREKGEILIVPAHGGPERKVADIAPAWQAVASNIMRLPGPSWTPDGRFLAITDRQGSTASTIVLVSIATGETKRITTSEGTASDEFPRVSPRGTWLAFARCVGVGICDLYIQPLSGGDAIPLTADRSSISGLTWSPDERSIIFSSSRDKNFRLWRVWIRSRTLAPIDGAGLHVTQPSLAAGVLAFQEVFENINLWRLDLRASAPARPLITSSRKTHSPSLSPDGTRLAFVSNAPAGDEIWTAHADGRDAVQITSTGGRAGSPRWSPDGGSIAFDSAAEGLSAIYVIAASGGTPRRLTRGPGNDAMPSWSHDGRWIYYNSVQAGQGQIWKIAATGDMVPVQITRQGAHEPFESVDGKYVYYLKAHPPYDVWRVPSGGGEETPVEGLGGDIRVSRCWAVTDRGIYFITSGSAPRLGLYAFDRHGVEWLAAIERPAPDTTPSLTVAPDHSAVIYAQIDSRASDIIALQGFR